MTAVTERPRKTSARAEAPRQQLDLREFFSGGEAREDRWQRLNAAAKRLSRTGAGSPDEAARILSELEPLEAFWAYPGLRSVAALRDLLARQDYIGFARLTDRLGKAILRGTYRTSAAAWDLGEELEEPEVSIVGPYLEEEQQRPYFELLVVRDGVRGEAEHRIREEMRRNRRPEDPFIYEPVFVSTFEDAVIAVLFNANIQAVVIYDGFPFRSASDVPGLGEFLRDRLNLEGEEPGSGELATALAAAVYRIRPELDVYMLTDQAVESLAGGLGVRNIRRIFYDVEEFLELHLAILDGVNDRYETPYFDNLKKYSRRPIGTFHALPIARGKSVFRSNWIRDMGHFYGVNLFLAESSATTGGLDSLLEPTGNIKEAQQKAARCFGARKAFFGTNGTSTSNKIVVQGLVRPGDIVLIDRNCHKSHHYGLVLAGGQPYYLEAFPLNEFSMYGGVPLRTIKQALLDLKAEGKLDRVRMLDLTNCTFDGHVYNVKRVMEECLAIKPDLIFLWDEAWFSFARFSPYHRRRTGMAVAEELRARYASPAYRAEYEAFKKQVGELDGSNAKLLDRRLLPDPDQVRIRVYATHSVHKSLSSLRQGSLILVNDDDFDSVEEAFTEAFLTHTSTSPNLQIIASLDVARRQAELEGHDLVTRHTGLALRLRREVNNHPLISKYFRILTPAEMIPAELRESGLANYGPPNSTWREVINAWDQDEFALDPTRLTLMCGTAGFDGTSFKNRLAADYDIQINKTSRNTVLLMTNINNTRSDISYVIKVLADMARDIDAKVAASSEAETLKERVKSLVQDVPDLPNFSAFHDAFRGDAESRTLEGDMREAFYLAYDAGNCEYLKLNSKDIDDRLKNGPPMVSANFVIPYPPGFPILVPGQVVSADTITYMRKLDVKEIHGYKAATGIKMLKPDLLGLRSKKTGNGAKAGERDTAARRSGPAKTRK
jgi:arginine decarboxylase